MAQDTFHGCGGTFFEMFIIKVEQQGSVRDICAIDL